MRSPQRGADRHRNGNRRRHATPRTEAQALPSPRAQLRHGGRVEEGARWRAIPSGGRRGWCPCRLPPMGHTDTCQSRQPPRSSQATPVHKEPGSHARSNGLGRSRTLVRVHVVAAKASSSSVPATCPTAGVRLATATPNHRGATDGGAAFVHRWIRDEFGALGHRLRVALVMSATAQTENQRDLRRRFRRAQPGRTSWPPPL